MPRVNRSTGIFLTGLRDSAGKVILGFPSLVASAVNYFQVSNAASGAGPTLAAAGSGTHVPAIIDAKGTANILLRDVPLVKMGTITQITTAGAGTYTAAILLAGAIDRDCTGGGRTDTLDTAAALVAAIPGVAVGDTLRVPVVNNSDAAEAITIAAGTGGTLKNVAAAATIPQNISRDLLIKFTNVTAASEAYDLYVI
jgi:hypothetical protein